MPKVKIKQTFSRVVPGTASEDLNLGWVAINFRLIEGKGPRRALYGKLVRIKSSDSVIFRHLRFAPRLKTNQILLDWNGYIDLSGRTGEEHPEMELEIRPANLFERLFSADTHPDPTYRDSMKLARYGIYLAVLAMLQSLLQTL